MVRITCLDEDVSRTKSDTFASKMALCRYGCPPKRGIAPACPQVTVRNRGTSENHPGAVPYGNLTLLGSRWCQFLLNLVVAVVLSALKLREREREGEREREKEGRKEGMKE